MNCPKCRFENGGGVRFCGRCGASLSRPGKPFDPDRTETLAYSCGELSDGSLFAGRYLVIDELGKGGMGCVYRVLDTKVDEEVALKFINPDIAADAKIIERFRTELKVTRRITHRHVCRMYDLSSDGKALFITMEYIQGEDLANMIQRLGKLPLEKAFIIARQAAEGLAEVHRLGVVHRDLKPKNIMIDRDGEAKIMDFGLARTAHGVKLTEVGHVVGTPSFMSPEQLNGETLDQRSDIFALGVVMYSMLTGILPFDAETTLKLALQHKTHHPPNPHSLNPRVPENLGRIILKCLEIDKEKRYPSARDLLVDLDKTAVAFDTYDVHVPGRSGKKAAGLPSRLPWTRVLTGALVVLALAVSGLAIKTLLRKPEMAAAPKPVVQVPAPVKSQENEIVNEIEKVKGIPVTFITVPSRATVFVDEIEMGISDDTFLLSPGGHAVRISKPGYQDLLATLAAEPGGPDRLRREYKLVPQPPTLGTLNITSEPSEADVYLEGSPKPAGRTPFTLGRSPGKVRVKVSMAGYHEQTEDIDVRAGERSALYCPLSPRDGTVEISSDPAGAEVYSGGELIGKTPFTRQLKPAVYRLRFTLKGRDELEDIISVHPGETLPPLHYMLKKPRTAPERYFLKVTSDPPGASVTVNGVLQKETTPFVWELDTSEVRIKVDKGGFKSREEVIVLKPAPDRNEKSYELKKTG
jgi:tRNA A-37 threonylcarbamoyl transferase component Bud32